jgi:hypothetical protein
MAMRVDKTQRSGDSPWMPPALAQQIMAPNETMYFKVAPLCAVLLLFPFHSSHALARLSEELRCAKQYAWSDQQ